MNLPSSTTASTNPFLNIITQNPSQFEGKMPDLSLRLTQGLDLSSTIRPELLQTWLPNLTNREALTLNEGQILGEPSKKRQVESQIINLVGHNQMNNSAERNISSKGVAVGNPLQDVFTSQQNEETVLKSRENLVGNDGLNNGFQSSHQKQNGSTNPMNIIDLEEPDGDPVVGNKFDLTQANLYSLGDQAFSNPTYQQLLLQNLALGNGLGMNSYLGNPLQYQLSGLVNSYGLQNQNSLLNLMGGLPLGNQYLGDLSAYNYPRIPDYMSQYYQQAQASRLNPMSSILQATNPLLQASLFNGYGDMSQLNHYISANLADKLYDQNSTQRNNKPNTILKNLEKKMDNSLKSGNPKTTNGQYRGVSGKRNEIYLNLEVDTKNKVTNKIKEKVLSKENQMIDHPEENKSENSEKDSKSSNQNNKQKRVLPKREKISRNRYLYELTPEFKPLKKERKMNKLQIVRENPVALDTPSKETSNYTFSLHIENNDEKDIIKTMLGENYQAQLTPFSLNNPSFQKKKKIKCKWWPSCDYIKDFEELSKCIEEILGINITNQAKIVKLLRKNKMCPEQAIEEVKSNKNGFLKEFEITPAIDPEKVEGQNI